MSLRDGAMRHLLRVLDEPALEGTRYRLIGLLGRGGMSSVWEVEDVTLGRHLALKVVGASELDTLGAARLEEEARTIAGLEHPGIVPLHEVGTLSDGRTYCAMKLVRGVRLDRFLAARSDLRERLRILDRVCETVAFAHARGVVHRDLKPANVMVGEFGEVLVLDWGVAFAHAPTEPEGTVVGTEGFMAPEQARGEVAATGARADVFALGKLLGSMIDGAEQRPSRALVAIAAKAVAADAGARYRDAAALTDDLHRERDGRAVSAVRETPLTVIARFHRRYAAAIWVIVAYLVMRVSLLWLPLS